MKYTINYGTGTGNETANTLKEAMTKADKGAAYTHHDIVIMDNDEREVARRKWWNVPYNPAEDESLDPIKFGKNGYYADWEIAVAVA